MNLIKCVGMKIVAMKGFVHNPKKRKKTNIEVDYILFDDEKTYIELEEQDYYTYHDCSPAARTLTVREDARIWKIMMLDYEHYPDADSILI